MIKRLYIIGNGFDLHHGLKTSYFDFSEYLQENYNELYNILESYIYCSSPDNCLWSKFEENLANLDVEEILSENTDRLPDYASDDFRDRDRHVFPDIMGEYHRKLTEGLLETFKRFIQDVEISKKAFQYKINLDTTATFLTFNYTNTLERLYNIHRNKITYIHNSAFETDDIFLGHGTDPEKFEEKKPVPPNGLTEEECERWYEEHDSYDYSYDTGKETIMKYYKDTFKPTNEIIIRHNSFFSKLIEIDEVNILGHSLSNVDLPYFKEIVKHIKPSVNWNVSYYDNKEIKSHLKSLLELGLNEQNIILFEMEDQLINNKQLKINF